MFAPYLTQMFGAALDAELRAARSGRRAGARGDLKVVFSRDRWLQATGAAPAFDDDEESL